MEPDARELVDKAIEILDKSRESKTLADKIIAIAQQVHEADLPSELTVDTFRAIIGIEYSHIENPIKWS